MKLLILALLATALPMTANAASFSFTWDGGNGYHMEGAFSISDSSAKAEYIHQEEVTCFRIEGFLDGDSVGSWKLGQLTDETSWRLNFEPRKLQFRVPGKRYARPYVQAWNMNGGGYDCGAGGFGFNIGSAAQDICINNRLIRASQVPPSKPLKAVRDDTIKFKGSDCNIMLLS